MPDSKFGDPVGVATVVFISAACFTPIASLFGVSIIIAPITFIFSPSDPFKLSRAYPVWAVACDFVSGGIVTFFLADVLRNRPSQALHVIAWTSALGQVLTGLSLWIASPPGGSDTTAGTIVYFIAQIVLVGPSSTTAFTLGIIFMVYQFQQREGESESESQWIRGIRRPPPPSSHFLVLHNAGKQMLRSFAMLRCAGGFRPGLGSGVIGPIMSALTISWMWSYFFFLQVVGVGKLAPGIGRLDIFYYGWGAFLLLVLNLAAPHIRLPQAKKRGSSSQRALRSLSVTEIMSGSGRATFWRCVK